MSSLKSILLGCLLSGLLVSGPVAQDGLTEWVKTVETAGDDADPAMIEKIAGVRSRAAMEALIAIYERMGSIYMRREVIRALVAFDGVEDAEQPALEKLTNVATNAREPELRDASLEALGRCEHLGKDFLRMIVDSGAEDEVREKAMQLHVKRAGPDDAAWYRHIWNPKRDRRKTAAGEIEPFELEAIRELAFAGLVSQLDQTELIDSMRAELFNGKLRRAALTALRDQKSPKTAEMALWMLERVDLPGPDRAHAAAILVAEIGPNAVPTFLQLAKKRDVTTEDLRRNMAELIGDMNDDATNKKMLQMIGRGKEHEQVFAIQATAHINDPATVKRIRAGLKDKDFEVRRATAETLAKRKDQESLPDLHKMLDKPKSPGDLQVAIDAISAIDGKDKAWQTELVELSGHEDRDARNAALTQLSAMKDKKYLPLFVTRLEHEDWTTRLVAIRALGELRRKDGIPPLIERLAAEQGRMSRIVADTLWNLTAQTFEENIDQWRQWWTREGAAFTVASPDQLLAASKEREQRRLRARTRTEPQFFGIRIESHRVIFVIDTSGSMVEPVYGRYVGTRVGTRIDVAKKELSGCIENLDPNAFFNILAFSSGIGYWLKSGIASSSEKTRAEALEFVDRLGAGGATNLYDAVKVAFDDPDVDTICVLSDGEPTAGEETDPHRIRENVKFWNRHRGIKINTISIGGNLEVLEWIATDSGGIHVRIR